MHLRLLLCILLSLTGTGLSAADRGIYAGPVDPWTYTFTEGQAKPTAFAHAAHVGIELATYGGRVLTAAVTANGDSDDDLRVIETRLAEDENVRIVLTEGAIDGTTGITFNYVLFVTPSDPLDPDPDENGIIDGTPTYSSIQIGYFEGGSGGEALRVVLNDFARPEFKSITYDGPDGPVPAILPTYLLLRSLVFSNASQDPREQTKTITMSFDGQIDPAPRSDIQMDPVNDLPIITDSTLALPVNEAASGSGTVTFTDIDQGDGEAFSIAMVQQPAKGSVAFTDIEQGFSWTYIADDDVGGNDIFIYRIRDFDGGLSTAQQVVISIRDVNDPPVFTLIDGNDSVAMVEDSTLMYSVVRDVAPCERFPDHESQQTVSFELLSNSNPSLFSEQPVISGDGVLSARAANDITGVANLSFRIVDDGGTAFGGEDSGDTLSIAITVSDDASDVASIDSDCFHAVAGHATPFQIEAQADGGAEIVAYTKLTDPGNGFVVLDTVTGAGLYLLARFPAAAQGSTATINDPMQVAVTDSNGTTVAREISFVVSDPQAERAGLGRLRIVSTPTSEVVSPGGVISYLAIADASTLGQQVAVQWAVDGLAAESVAIDNQGNTARIDLAFPALSGIYQVSVRCWDANSGTADVQTLYFTVRLGADN
jgi:hypothetical protein